jgi:hypothetical protein
MDEKKISIVISSIFCLVGVLLIIIGYFNIYLPDRQFYNQALKTGGFVNHQELHPGEIILQPVITYTIPATTNSYTLQPPENGKLFRYTAGEKVTILYNPAAPDNGRLDHFTTFWFKEIVLLLFALPFVLLGLFALIKSLIYGSLQGNQEKSSITADTLVKTQRIAIVAAACLILIFILKNIFDLPKAVFTPAYFMITFCLVFVLVITTVIVLIKKDRNK